MLPGGAGISPLCQCLSRETLAVLAVATKLTRRVLNTKFNIKYAPLCQRLDGLPLGIELTAHLMRLFSPRAVFDRLAAQHPLPSVIVRDLPERQPSLHATVEWS